MCNSVTDPATLMILQCQQENNLLEENGIDPD